MAAYISHIVYLTQERAASISPDLRVLEKTHVMVDNQHLVRITYLSPTDPQYLVRSRVLTSAE